MSTGASTLSSMTGFASQKIHLKSGSILSIEAKTLNGRFLDIKLRLAKELTGIESQIRSFVQSSIQRGTLELKLEIQKDPSVGTSSFDLNADALAHYLSRLKAAQKKLKIPGKIEIADLLGLPDVWMRTTSDAPIANDPDAATKLWKTIEPGLKKTLQSLASMRAHEGTALCQHLTTTLTGLTRSIDELRRLREKSQASYKKKLTDKICLVFESYLIENQDLKNVIESRVSQELAVLLEKTDIEEELTRLGGHFEHFLETLREGGAVGRKLEFILQEIHRETNTLGTKAQDFQMSDQVVQLKVAIEQIREQVLNLE